MTVQKVSEAAFQKTVAEWAMRNGWLVAHFDPATSEERWRTPTRYDAKGFPDLVLVRGPAIVWVELKSDKGRLRDDQKRWLEALRAAGEETHVWRPRDWPEVERRLSRRG